MERTSMFTDKATKTKQWSRHRFSAISAFSAAAILLTVCGSSGSSFAGTLKPRDSASGTLNVDISVQYSSVQPGLDGGLALNTFPPGLKINEIVGASGALTMAAGGADIYVGSASGIIPAILLGLQAKIVGVTIPVWTQHMIVLASSKYTSLASLEGAKFGVQGFGGASDYSVQTLAQKQGWSTSQYSEVSATSLSALTAELQSGAIDAFPYDAVTAASAVANGWGRDLGSLAPIVGNVPLDVITVSDSALKNHPVLVQDFLNGFYKAQSILQTSSSIAIPLFEKWGVPATIAQSTLPTNLALLATAPGLTTAECVGLTSLARFTSPSNANIQLSQVEGMVQLTDSALHVVATQVTGVAVPGKRVAMSVVGSNFYGTPKITSNAAGTTVRVVKTKSSSLSLTVKTRAGTSKGVRLLTIRFAKGQVVKIRYFVN